MVLNDMEILERCINFGEHGLNRPMLDPFIGTQVREKRTINPNSDSDGRVRKVMSFGLSSFGYDARVANDIRIFSPIRHHEIDPKNFNPALCEPAPVHGDDFNGHYVLIPAHSFALGRTVEYITLPRDTLMQVFGKSTYARCGMGVPATPGEPGWHGYLTLEFSNHTPVPIRLYVDEGAVQLVFHRGLTCRTSYTDRAGKYNGQLDVTFPKV